jgi:hypothetical protein
VTDRCLNDMRCFRGGLTLGVHKIPFRVFSSNGKEKLTVNGQFMRDFMAEESPCFALGLVEERKQPCGFLALRPAEVIPPEISGLGFNFGHALLGTTEFEVIQFVFHFYGFETYNILVNPLCGLDCNVA